MADRGIPQEDVEDDQECSTLLAWSESNLVVYIALRFWSRSQHPIQFI